MSRVVYKASCWDCQEFYIGKTKRRLHDRKTKHFKSITRSNHSSAIVDRVKSTGYNMKGTISKFWQEDGRTLIAR